MFSVESVASPAIDIGGFAKIAGQGAINAADAKQTHATVRFHDLADCGEIAYHHIYQTFSFVLHPTTVLEIQSFGLDIRVTGEIEGMLVTGLFSASLWTWKRFLLLATAKDQSEFLIRVANSMFLACFTKVKYFQELQTIPQHNQTFMLVQKK